jgi:catechol-2,3-dioxygenase
MNALAVESIHHPSRGARRQPTVATSFAPRPASATSRLTSRRLSCTDPREVQRPAREEIMASPKKLSHIVLQTNRRPEMIDWYCTVLGAEVLYEAERISFISYDDEHHRVAFLDPGPLAEREPDGPKAGKEAGLHHVAFTFGGLDELIDNHQRLKAIGISPHRCVNHGVTTSMYYHDPDRNQVELLVDNFATAAEGQAYMRSRRADDKNPVGIVYDPEELVGQVRSGLKIEELAGIN